MNDPLRMKSVSGGAAELEEAGRGACGGLNSSARTAMIGLLLATSCAAQLGAQARTPRTEPLTERERAIHLLNRATFGVRAQDVERMMQIGRDDWIEQQLRPETVEASLPEAGPGTVQMTAIRIRPNDVQLQEVRVAFRGAADQGDDLAAANKLVRALRSERQLEHVMTDFWVNHFNVYQGKQYVAPTLADYDDTVRRHVFGRFRDLLGATAKHPSMLVYLDNWVNGIPPSGATDAEIRANRSINENYARELLELHTLGVDGGYTQQDVIDVARAFTGWSTPLIRNQSGFQAKIGPPTFLYQATWHDPDEKVVLGRTLAAGRGIEDGEEVLDLLARHPSTARHVATKLIRHFVADDPPTELVDEIARVFTATDGDLAAVTRALFTDERFYAPAHYRAKVKRPFEFVVSSLRVMDARLSSTSTVAFQNRLARLQHAPYFAPAPTGYPVTADYWLNTGAMIERMNLAQEMSDGAVQFIPYAVNTLVDAFPEQPVTVDPWTLLGIERESFATLGGDGIARASTPRVLERTLQGVSTAQLEATLAGLVSELTTPTTPEEMDVYLRRAIALVLGSPEFQRY